MLVSYEDGKMDSRGYCGDLEVVIVLSSHPSLDLVASAREVVEDFDALLSDEDIILETDTSELAELGNLLLDEELGGGRVLECRVECVVVEVHTRLAGDDHAGDKRASGAELADAWLVDALVAAWEAANVVGIEADEVAKTVGHEDSTHVSLEHLVNVSLEESTLLELCKHNALSQTVHIRPHNTRTHSSLYAALHGKDSLINIALVLGELTVGREGGGEITIIAVVLSTDVHKAHVSILDLLVVGKTSMTVVESSTVGTTGTDGSVAHVAAAAVVVGVVEESGLQLVLHHSGLNGTHHGLVGISSDANNIAHDLNLSRALAHTADTESLHNLAVVHTVVLDAVKLGRREGNVAVAVDTAKDVHTLGLKRCNVACKIAHETGVVHLIHLGVVLRRLDLAEDNLEAGVQIGNVERRLALHVDRRIKVGLLHTKQVLEVGLLLEHKLNVAVVNGLRRTAAENNDGVLLHIRSLELLQEARTVVRVHLHRHNISIKALREGRHGYLNSSTVTMNHQENGD